MLSNFSIFVLILTPTRFALGKQSNILNINFAFPSGSSGKHTPVNNFHIFKINSFLCSIPYQILSNYLMHLLSFGIDIE